MKRTTLFIVLLVGFAVAGSQIGRGQVEGQELELTDSSGLAEKEWKRGLAIAPVPLNLEGKSQKRVGLGSYIVNARSTCNDCHTTNANPFAAGGNPFSGEPEKVDPDRYLVGGRAMPPPAGPFITRNLRPDASGKPAGLTLEQFTEVLRTGKDFKDIPPNPLLQVMPWPTFRKMTDDDIRNIYEYLSALPPHAGFPQ